MFHLDTTMLPPFSGNIASMCKGVREGPLVSHYVEIVTITDV